MKNKWLRFIRGVILKVYYPLLMLIGAFYKKKKEALQGHVIAINNRLVEKEGIRTSRILVLLPHCLQIDKCDIRITHDIYNCKRCGRCNIKDFIGIAEDKKLDLFVATGGSLARKIVQDVRPSLIVAVACERDLSSGIADAYPLPVYGIPNDRPYGPCFNTSVDVKKIEQALSLFGAA
jgi:hypothetical protein